MPETAMASATMILKDRTAAHHRRAERSDFQQALLRGRISRRDYVAWLGQMLCVYRALESAWMRSGCEERFTGLGVTSWARSPNLERDLAALGADIAPAPVPAALPFLALLDALGGGSGHGLLGVVYVLEGSTNGSVYIARGVRTALQLPATIGTEFLDPHGERQRERWAAFKAALDAAVPPESCPTVEAAAAATFDAMVAIGEAVQGERHTAAG